MFGSKQVLTFLISFRSIKSLYLLCRYITTAVNLKIFPSVVNSIGLHNMFWIHGCLCIFMCVCGMMILPETQGKTLTELSEIYSAKEKKTKCVENFQK